MPAPRLYVTFENPSAAFICSAAKPTLIRSRYETTYSRNRNGIRRRRALATAVAVVVTIVVRYYTGVQGPITTAPESRARVTVVWFVFLLAFVTYLDRVCISAAARYIRDDLRLSTQQMGVALSAFALAYAVFEIPSGWLADLIGPRKVLTRIVLWWSGFTMLTAAAAGFASLVVIRFLFGAG